MMLLDDHMFNLWRQGLITKEDGLAKCNDAGRAGNDGSPQAERGMFDDQPDEEDGENAA